MSLISIRKALTIIAKPYATISTSAYGTKLLQIPPEIAWLRTYNTYCTPNLYNSTRLMHKNLGMLLGRINNISAKPNGIYRYHRVKRFR